MNNYYNPMQSRVDSLMQQKAMIEQQLQSLQQMNVPNININNIPSNPTPSNFDFNGKWELHLNKWKWLNNRLKRCSVTTLNFNVVINIL